MLTTVISGGQTGADQAALAAARDLGFRTGGWMPRNFWTDSGSRPELAIEFGLQEHSLSGYPARTLANVLAAHGTLIFGNDRSPGCSLTKMYCKKNQRPSFVKRWSPLDRGVEDLFTPDMDLIAWLRKLDPTVLNVAGNRERTHPGIGSACKAYLITTLRYYRDHANAD